MHEMPPRRYLLLALTAIVVGCHSPTSPNDELASQPHGRLSAR